MNRRKHQMSTRDASTLVCAPTREEHDAIVAARGRPFTDTGMVVKAPKIPDGMHTEASVVDRYITPKGKST